MLKKKSSFTTLFQFDESQGNTLGAQELPLSNWLSSEAKAWLASCYGKLYGKTEASALAAEELGGPLLQERVVEYANYLKQSFIEEEQSLIEHTEVTIEKIRILDLQADLIVPQCMPPSEDRPCILFLSDSQALMGHQSLGLAVHLANTMKTQVIVPYLEFARSLSDYQKITGLLEVLSEIQSVYSKNLAIVGELEGANLAMSLITLVYQHERVMPRVLGLVSPGKGQGDWGHHAGQTNITNLKHLFDNVSTEFGANKTYADENNYDPIQDPRNANMDIFPPTILLSSTRDINLSDTVFIHREMKRCEKDTKLCVFEGLPQLFYLKNSLPETRDLCAALAAFLGQRLYSE